MIRKGRNKHRYASKKQISWSSKTSQSKKPKNCAMTFQCTQSLCKLREVQEYRLSMLITIELFIYRGAILELINHVYVHAYINICALVKKHACIHIKEYTGTYTNLQSILMNVCVPILQQDTIWYHRIWHMWASPRPEDWPCQENLWPPWKVLVLSNPPLSPALAED